jgi:hypothetical protein
MLETLTPTWISRGTSTPIHNKNRKSAGVTKSRNQEQGWTLTMTVSCKMSAKHNI